MSENPLWQELREADQWKLLETLSYPCGMKTDVYEGGMTAQAVEELHLSCCAYCAGRVR